MQKVNAGTVRYDIVDIGNKGAPLPSQKCVNKGYISFEARTDLAAAQERDNVKLRYVVHSI